MTDVVFGADMVGWVWFVVLMDPRSRDVWSCDGSCQRDECFLSVVVVAVAWQYPKDFSLISSFLPYKSTQDCVAFYYNTKPAAEYKHKLKAQSVALRRRSSRNGWALAVQAFEAVGYAVCRVHSSTSMGCMCRGNAFRAMCVSTW